MQDRHETDVVINPARAHRNFAAAPVMTAVIAGAGAIGAAATFLRWRKRVRQLEELMPPPQVNSTFKRVFKPTPDSAFVDRGTGTDFETRLSTLDAYLTPNERFFIRSHSPTPHIDVNSWRLSIEGTGLRRALALSYDAINAMPKVTVQRVIECAGNGRRFFKEAFGVEAEGAQWRTGAIGAAEWTGVRLRDLLDNAGVKAGARDVMPEGLDELRVRRPMPIAKALGDDTLLVLEMNGRTLSPDHGFPARMLVPGWAGAASIKWVGRIEVSEEPLHSPWNTVEYVLIGPHYRAQTPALGHVIAEMPVMSVIDLDWPAFVMAGTTTIYGRAFAGEGKTKSVVYRIDDDPWREAEILPPNIEGCWVRWRFDWRAEVGDHEIRVRATDEQGRAQPDAVPWNHHGYLYNAVVAHPVRVTHPGPASTA